ncbi:MAG: isochorismate synthase [Verrucomicrobia bacterium]|nr:isochorismate synthase [Verrucomicrobiota bacterium]
MNKKEVSYALFKHPGNGDIHLFFQENTLPERISVLHELNNKTGFVIAPFTVSNETPILLLHPEYQLHEAKEIIAFLRARRESFSQNSSESLSLPYLEETNVFQQYSKAFQTVKNLLSANKLKKIVLARTASIRNDTDLDTVSLFFKACENYPNEYIVLFHTPFTGTWLSATPELLLEHTNEIAHTIALAGTITDKKHKLPIQWNNKNIKEQQIVADFIRSRLYQYPITSTVYESVQVHAGKLSHLKTNFYFKIGHQKFHEQVGDILDSLHPTPAVCGVPQKESMKLISKLEYPPRLYYSGFTGMLDMDRQTHFYVTLRCLKMDHDHLTLYAGGGILPMSQMESEWEETEGKLKIMKSLITT